MILHRRVRAAVALLNDEQLEAAARALNRAHHRAVNGFQPLATYDAIRIVRTGVEREQRYRRAENEMRGMHRWVAEHGPIRVAR